MRRWGVMQSTIQPIIVRLVYLNLDNSLVGEFFVLFWLGFVIERESLIRMQIKIESIYEDYSRKKNLEVEIKNYEISFKK